LYGGGSFGGNARPAASSAARAAAYASSPSKSRTAPVAIQTPERSGLPSAVRGTSSFAAMACARSTCGLARTAANESAASGRRAVCHRVMSAPAGAGRRPGRERATVRERDPARGAEIRLRPRVPALDRDRVAGLQRDVALPTLAHEHVRRIALEPPTRDRAVVALDVDREMDVGVGPFDVGDLPAQLERTLAVEDRRERVVAAGGPRSEHPRHRREHQVSPHRPASPALGARLW